MRFDATSGLLCAIDRSKQRRSLGLNPPLPFVGEDVWNCYEVSWLSEGGVPVVGALRIRVPCTTPATVESKSLKLYLNAFSQTSFGARADVVRMIEADLTALLGEPADVSMLEPGRSELSSLDPGQSLDGERVAIETYERDAGILDDSGGDRIVEQSVHTDLFASLCPVTGWPDWASVLIDYRGPEIDRRRLLRYLVSYRRHRAFHETVVEQIFVDIMERCACEHLTVDGRFLRRGGIDINPFRSTHLTSAPTIRLPRQ